MEKDRSDMIIEKLREMIEEGPGAPLSPGKVVVVRSEAVDLLDTLQDTIHKEMVTYREISDRKAKILQDARDEAERILSEAERGASRIRVTKRRDGEPLSFSLQDMDPDDRKSLRTANDIYAASLIYTDEMLTEADHLISDAVDKIEQEYMKMRATLKEKKRAISENKTELIRSLNSLTQEDRYSQLLEIADLLSEELYLEKKKQLAKEQEGQMEIHFDKDLVPEQLGGDQDAPSHDKKDRKETPAGDAGEVKAKRVRPAINPDRTQKKIEVESHAAKEARPRGTKTIHKKD